MSLTIHTILHVEDDANDVLLVQRAVRRGNLPVQVTTVADGEAAINYLSGAAPYHDRHGFPFPELVLLDLKIPRKSGLEVLAWMRERPECRRLPVAILTSSRHERDMEAAYDAGANSYLVKPVAFDGLLEMVKVLYQYWFSLNQMPAR